MTKEKERFTSEKIAYLNIIQGLITRLSNYNTTVRNWTVVTLIGISTLECHLKWNPFIQGCLNLIPIGLFVWMSLFYHSRVRRYIKLYERSISEDCSHYLFELNLSHIPKNEKFGDFPTFFESFDQSKFNMAFGTIMILWAFLFPNLVYLASH